jgi:uncharacterized surface protein with fasciclin (FAS1) repeats
MTKTPTSRGRRFGTAFVAALLAGGLLLAACGDSDDGGEAASAPSDTSAAPETTAPPAAPTETSTDMVEPTQPPAAGGEMLGASGPACGSVPMAGEGSFAGMADDTAATAASNNPLLSTLVTAVAEADLVDTLNSDGPFTVFAPTNDAFAAIPADQLDAVLADVDLLTSVLTYHVIAGDQLSSQELVDAGSATTVNGAELTFTASGDSVQINGGATTICQDVPTANATVHIIDGVLLPS